MHTRSLAIRYAIHVVLTICSMAALSACSDGDIDTSNLNSTDNSGIGQLNEPANDPSDNSDSDDNIIDVSNPLSCHSASQTQWAYDSMQDFYLFYDQVPVVNPQSYESANDLVRSVRFAQRDDFSRVTDAQASTLQFDAGREFGLGYNFVRNTQGEAQISKVVPDSPFGRAGIERGDIILTVNGLAFDSPELPGIFIDSVIGSPDEPASSVWMIKSRDTEETVELNITTAEYTIDTVPLAAIYRGGTLSSALGYIHFTRFLETSVAELENAFTAFAESGVGELILDLRYNGGGRVSVARYLASKIAGSERAGDTIYEYRFNNKYQDDNFILDFAAGLGDLNLSRVIVLTTGRTASSSEIVIAGLQPHMEVVTIGTRSTGKPYIQYAYTRCGEQLAVIEAEGFNDAGVSVFGGIPATCYAEDDLTRNLGLNEDGVFEGFLNAAVDYINHGTCATAPPEEVRSFLKVQNDEGKLAGYRYDGGALAN